MTDSRTIDAAAMTALAERALDGDEAATVDLLRESAGSVDALRALYEAGITSHDNPAELPMAAARFEVIARLIAAKTGATRDRRCVEACLTTQALEHHRCGDFATAGERAMEALAILRQLVDEGDGEALIGLANYPEQFAHLRKAQETQKAATIVPDALTQARADLDQERARSDALADQLTAAPLTRWECFKFWCDDRLWRLRFLGWALADVGRAALDCAKR